MTTKSEAILQCMYVCMYTYIPFWYIIISVGCFSIYMVESFMNEKWITIMKNKLISWIIFSSIFYSIRYIFRFNLHRNLILSKVFYLFILNKKQILITCIQMLAANNAIVGTVTFLYLHESFGTSTS